MGVDAGIEDVAVDIWNQAPTVIMLFCANIVVAFDVMTALSKDGGVGPLRGSGKGKGKRERSDKAQVEYTCADVAKTRIRCRQEAAVCS